MKKITYFYRSLSSAFSIKKVSQTITTHIGEKEELYVPFTGFRPKTILGNIWYVFIHRNRKGINHITGEIYYCTIGLIGCKSVITIHDTVSIDFHKGTKLKNLILEWLLYRIPLRLATKVICISEETKRCVQRFTKRDDIVVIHNAVDPCIKYSEEQERNRPAILFIGTNPNKNLLRCFNALKGIDCDVTIIGRLKEEHKESLRINGIKYKNRFGLTDEEIYEEYRKCNLVSFISLFEGFGMPVIEAGKAGRAVIASNIPVLKEVGQDSVLYVNPEDEMEIRAGYKKILFDIGYRKFLVKRGIENVQKYDYSVILPKWLDVYETIKE